MKTYLNFVLGIVLGIVIGFVIFMTTPIGQRYHVTVSNPSGTRYDAVPAKIIKYDSWSGKVYIFEYRRDVWVPLPNFIGEYRNH